MLIKTLLVAMLVVSLLTYKFPIMIPLGFSLVVFYLYKVHKMLITNKEIIDENNERINQSITTLLTNQKTLSSDIKNIRRLVDSNGKKIKEK